MTQPGTVSVNLRTYTGQPVRLLDLHADYACANTGLCCEDTWGIPVTPVEIDEVGAALNAAEAQGPTGLTREFAIPDPRPTEAGNFRIATGACGCVYHGREAGVSQCLLQRKVGHRPLPVICQSFPRLALRTPGGIYLTLTYACPTAAKLLEKPNALREVAARGVIGLNPKLGGSVFGERAEPPLLNGHAPQSWEAFDYFWRWTPEWMSQPTLAPDEALFGLGHIVAHVEGLGRAAADMATLVDQLEQVSANFAKQLKPICAQQQRETLLGTIYFETLLNIVAQVHTLPDELREVHTTPDTRAALAADYDRLIRPTLADFSNIERNYIASRLYANPLAYRGALLRTGYFVAVLTAIALRYAALAIARREGTPLSAAVLLKAAACVDKLLLHNGVISGKFIDLLEQRINTPMPNLALPALA